MKIDEVGYDDPKTWELYHNGRTKGVFQLESNLGRHWAKAVKPNNIEELAALVSIIRPGTLKATIDGKSLTQIYVDRKHGVEPVTYIDECLEPILKKTQGILVYQEQAMQIAQKLAGFSEGEADVLRKAIGKKKADLMAKVRTDFINGCETVGMVDTKTADEIFGWIEKSARYSFNKSHAVAYAVNSYWSAYYKANYPIHFFVAYLRYANEKQDPHQEVYELCADAKTFDFDFKTPRIVEFRPEFYSDGQTINFGIKNVKSLTNVNGNKAIESLEKLRQEMEGDLSKISWMDILIHYSTEINATCFKTLAYIGFFRGISEIVSRNKALYEYDIFKRLTKAELAWITKNYSEYGWKTLRECFTDLAPTKKEGGGTSKEARKQVILNEIKMLDNPPYSLDDDPGWVIEQENKFLGCPVSMSRIDSIDIAGCNTTCKEILDGKVGKNIRIAANIVRVANHKIKKEGQNFGKEMSFLTIEDSTSVLDSVVIFPGEREENKYSLYENNNVVIHGNIGDKGSLVVEKMFEV